MKIYAPHIHIVGCVAIISKNCHEISHSWDETVTRESCNSSSPDYQRIPGESWGKSEKPGENPGLKNDFF
jgi:hypothetical protein